MSADVLSGAKRWHVAAGSALDVLRQIPDATVHACVTSPPYWGLRSYLPEGDPNKPAELGGERTPEEYVARMVEVFREVRRVLREDGTLWLNLGDCYATGAGRVGECPGGGTQGERWAGTGGSRGSGRPGKNGRGESQAAAAIGPMTQPNRMPIPGYKPKDLVGVPWSVAKALQSDGWYLRNDAPWVKFNGMPSSVADRLTVSHEYLFLLSKGERYFYDLDAVRKPHAMRPQRRPTGHARRRPDPLMSEHTFAGTMRDEPGIDGNPAGRQRRTSDVWRESLDLMIGDLRAYLAHLEEISLGGGMVTSPDGSPVGVLTATVPFDGAHFATFPPSLIQPCIRASASEGGCCRTCGAPRERIVGEAVPIEGRGSGNKARRIAGGAAGERPADHLGSGIPWRPTAAPTLGWRPTCDCAVGDPVPCLVLDPFSGAGTTGMVAVGEGRRYLGIELNPEYVALSAPRIDWAEQHPERYADPQRAKAAPDVQASLFGGAS